MPGVAQVAIGGEQKRSIRVQMDPAALASRGLTLEDVRGAIVAATTNAAKGALTTATTTYTIAANDQITKPEQFDDVIIAYRNGAPVRVRDVGHAISPPPTAARQPSQTTDPEFCSRSASSLAPTSSKRWTGSRRGCRSLPPASRLP